MEYLWQEDSLPRISNDYILDMDLALIYMESVGASVKEVCKRIITAVIKFIDRLAHLLQDLFRKANVKINIARMKARIKKNPELGRKYVKIHVHVADYANYEKFTKEVMHRVKLYIDDEDRIAELMYNYENKCTEFFPENRRLVHMKTGCTVMDAIEELEECVKAIDRDMDNTKRQLTQFYKITDDDKDYLASALSGFSRIAQKMTSSRSKMLSNDLANVMEAVYASSVYRSRTAMFDGIPVTIHIMNNYDKYAAMTMVDVRGPEKSKIDIYLSKEDLRLPEDELTTVIAHEIGHNVGDRSAKRFILDAKKEIHNIKAAMDLAEKNVPEMQHYSFNPFTTPREKEQNVVNYIMGEAEADVYALKTFARSDFSNLDQHVKTYSSPDYEHVYRARKELRNDYRL